MQPHDGIIYAWKKVFISNGPHLITKILLPKSNLSNVTKSREWESRSNYPRHGPFTRYVKLRVAHAPGIPGTFSPPPRFGDPDMHHGSCVTHELWSMPGSLTNGFFWSRLRGKRSRRMRNPQFYVFGKRPMECETYLIQSCMFGCLWTLYLKPVSIASRNVLAPNRRQSITWTKMAWIYDATCNHETVLS